MIYEPLQVSKCEKCGKVITEPNLNEMNEVKKPALNRMWETFIKMSWEDMRLGKHVNTIRVKIYPMISQLIDKRMINWYCFLIHNKDSGVPTSEDDRNPYFHIRIALKRGVDPNDFLNSLPEYCVMTHHIEHKLESITGIDQSIIKNGEIEEAWRIIGEQSEWLLNMLNIHKDGVDIPLQQIGQFLHFYANMTQLQVR